jgi:ATP-dependent DNA ligase
MPWRSRRSERQTCPDDLGRSQFKQLLYGRGTPVFAAFDLLWKNGQDLRQLPLLQRKRRLRAVVPRHSGSILYVDHLVGQGCALFKAVCQPVSQLCLCCRGSPESLRF